MLLGSVLNTLRSLKTTSYVSIAACYVCVAIGLCVLVIGGTSWFVYKTYTDQLESTQNVMANTAMRIDRVIADEFSYATYSLKTASQQIAKAEQDRHLIHMILSGYDKDILGMAWADNKGKFWVGSVSGIQEKAIDTSQREYVKAVLDNPTALHIGIPFTTTLSHTKAIPISLGIMKPNGKLTGVLTAHVRSAVLTRLIERVIDTQGISFKITAAQGTTVAEAQDTSLFSSNAIALESMKPDTFVLPGLLQQKQDAFFKRAVSKYPFEIVLAYDSTFVRKALYDKVFLHVIYATAFVLLVTAILLIVRKFIISPLAGLAYAAESIAGGNTDVMIPRNGAREIEVLADRIEDVKTAVSKAFQERENTKEENRTLEKIMKAKTRQARNLVHDMRAHAAIVITFSEIISNNQYKRAIDPQYAEYANDIKTSGSHLLEMVNEMLDLEKARSGKLELKLAKVDVEALLEQTVRCMKRKAQLRGIEIELEVEENMPELYADAKRLRRMVQNLLSNSIKCTKKDGVIDISYTLDEESRPVIRVTDTGRGMTPEQIKIALTEYGQVQHDDTEEHDSTGIGLPFVKQMMEEHGGHLEIQSEPGKGTTVTMLFDSQAARYAKPKLTLVKS